MSIITEEFEKICKIHSKNIAFYFIKSGKVISKTFSELHQDVRSAQASLNKAGVKNGDKLLAFASPDYNLLVYMLAIFKIGASVMYIDIFAKQDSFKSFFDEYRPNYVLVSNKTRFLKPFFRYARKTKGIINVDKNVAGFYKNDCQVDDKTPALITATTGSSGKPKAFIRTHKDLFEQLLLIRNNMKSIDRDGIILTTSYIYAFANLIQGTTTVLPNINLSLKKSPHNTTKKLKKFERLGITTIMTSPDFCLRLPNLYPKLKQLYFGGAILNYNEAKKIQAKYSKVDIWYVYGSTECALISGVNLDEYIDNLRKTGQCLLGGVCKGVEIHIDDNRHILVKSKALLKHTFNGKAKDEYYDTNDIGMVKDGKLFYIGKFGTLIDIKGEKYYANELEQLIILKYPELKKCAIIQAHNTNYVFVEDNVDKRKLESFLAGKIGATKVIKIRQIPRDVKHHTKTNYVKLKHYLR